MLGSTILYQRKKPGASAKLSLVALMDIFTILVFFLLLNSGESENIEHAKFVQLPDSSAGTAPHKELVVLIGKEEIWLGDVSVSRVDEVMADPEKTIESLAAALTAHNEKRTELTGFEKNNGFAVTIMGDKSVSYTLLKSVMATCREQNYRNISLAVNQVIPNRYGGASTAALTQAGAGG